MNSCGGKAMRRAPSQRQIAPDLHAHRIHPPPRLPDALGNRLSQHRRGKHSATLHRRGDRSLLAGQAARHEGTRRALRARSKRAAKSARGCSAWRLPRCRSARAVRKLTTSSPRRCNSAASDEVVVTDLDFPAGVTPWLRAADAPTLRVWKAVDGALDVESSRALAQRAHQARASLARELLQRASHRLAAVSRHRAAARAECRSSPWMSRRRWAAWCSIATARTSSSPARTNGRSAFTAVASSAFRRPAAARLTTHAGGWLHLQNAFDADRFERAVSKTGAASFSVGMPNFVALYALNASLRYLEGVGVAKIAAHADPLVVAAEAGLRELGVKPMCRWNGTRHSRLPASAQHGASCGSGAGECPCHAQRRAHPHRGARLQHARRHRTISCACSPRCWRRCD